MYQPTVHPRGPVDPDVLIVGEAPGQQEELAHQPFVGYSGKEVDRMCAEAKLNPLRIRFTNVVNKRPPSNQISAWVSDNKKFATLSGMEYHSGRWCMPDVRAGIEELHREINRCRPKVIVPLGGTALWALTGYTSISKWRGSMLAYEGTPLIPTYHPAAVLRQYSWRWVAVNDLRRVARALRGDGITRPNYRFEIRPSYDHVIGRLKWLQENVEYLSVDIETSKQQIACVGLAWTPLEAICIPLLSLARPAGYFSKQQELMVWKLLRSLLTSKKCLFQNGGYDRQYFAAQMGFAANSTDDTLLMQHALFPGTPKSLDFICSIYNPYYRYWKDDGKNWAPTEGGEEQHWAYNCEDAVNTLEAKQRMEPILEAFSLMDFYRNKLMRENERAFRMTLRGIRADVEYQQQFKGECIRQITYLNGWLHKVLKWEINVASPKQVAQLCYEMMRLPPVYKPGMKDGQKIKRLTCDADAIDEWLQSCEPLFRPILTAVKEIRSLNVFRSTFGEAKIDPDGRLRSEFKVGGTDTYRWASGTNVFDSGMNLQNIPPGDPMTTVMNILNTLAERLEDKKLKDCLQSGDKDGAIGRGFEILIDAHIRTEIRLAELERKDAERQQVPATNTKPGGDSKAADANSKPAGADGNAGPPPANVAASPAAPGNSDPGKVQGTVPGVHKSGGPAKAG